MIFFFMRWFQMGFVVMIKTKVMYGAKFRENKCQGMTFQPKHRWTIYIYDTVSKVENLTWPWVQGPTAHSAKHIDFFGKDWYVLSEYEVWINFEWHQGLRMLLLVLYSKHFKKNQHQANLTSLNLSLALQLDNNIILEIIQVYLRYTIVMSWLI